MMETSKHFQVTIGRNGKASVRSFVGIDTGEMVIFNKEQLEAELTGLLESAFQSGSWAGQSALQARLREQLGIEDTA